MDRGSWLVERLTKCTSVLYRRSPAWKLTGQVEKYGMRSHARHLESDSEAESEVQRSMMHSGKATWFPDGIHHLKLDLPLQKI